MPGILTVTLNPTIDISSTVERVVPGPKLRCEAPQIDPGGGGINVSRAIAIIGGDSTALVAVGGGSGRMLTELLGAEGIRHVTLTVAGETRQSVSVTDRAGGGQYRFVMPGPTWGDAETARATEAIVANAPEGGLVVLSGSQPPGVPADFPLRLAAALGGRARLIVDTSGAPLAACAATPDGIYLLRMDHEEAEALSGQRLESRAETLAFAASLVAARSAEVVVVAMGEAGNLLVSADTQVFCAPPKVKVASKVGAGDSFVGAMTRVLSEGGGLDEALRHGTAAAAAAVITEATRLCRREDVERLLEQCRAEPA